MSLISILLPVYNAAPFLTECLNSIVQQSDSNWELLAINDFSTDDSALILEEFASTDDRIHFFNNNEKGIIPALRLALQKSGGTLITRMDADDWMPTDKLAILRRGWEKQGRGHVITGLVDYFSKTPLGLGYRNYQDWLNRLTIHNTHYSEIYRECVLPSPAWLIHREDLRKAGDFKSDRYPEDYDLCFRFYEQGFSIIGMPQIVHHWRDHSNRTSRTSPVYANPNFLELKLFWFFKLDYDPKKMLVVWGAGKKGKWIAKYLLEQKISFQWITGNTRKQGINIYDHFLTGPDFLTTTKNDTQTIVAIAAPEGRIKIQHFFDEKRKRNGQDYYWVC